MRLRLVASVLLALVFAALLGPARAQQVPGQPPRRAQPPAPADPAAQPTPPPNFAPPPTGRSLRGVTWHPPADRAQAARELRQIASAGVEAVRTPLIRREALLSVADSLRLRLFQDLPAAVLSAGAFEAALPRLRWELERALLMARRHPSARHFGLLSRGDTSDPATCAALRSLAERVRRGPGPDGAVAYYGTPFVEDDRCAGATRLTLLDALNRERPSARLRRWRQARTGTAQGGDALPDSVSVGIGALGTWVDPSAEGLRAPHSPQSQARYLEKHLPPLLGDTVRRRAAEGTPATRPLDSLEASPSAVVFAHRWRDRQSGEDASLAGDPYGRRYGLRTAGGAPRPAMKVVRGLYTGRQAVFAFDAGRAPPGRFPWLMLMGWGLAAVLGMAYAGRARFRGLVRRYFGAARFYRDAVREERAALGTGSALLMGGASLCGGLVVTVFLLAVQETGPFVQLLRGASGAVRGAALVAVARPWLAVLAMAAFYAASLAAWAFLLSLATRGAHRLSATQALALVAWPRWTAFPLGAGAVAATTLPPGWMLTVSGVLAALWVLTSVAAVLRTLYDTTRLGGLSPLVAPALAFLNPVLLAAVMALFAVLQMLPEAHFIWHLATRS